MFLIAITDRPVKREFPGEEVWELRADSAYITVLTDGVFSRVSGSEDRLTLYEAPGNWTGGNEGPHLAEVNYNRETGRVELVKPTLSGRPVYYHLNSRGELYCSTHIRCLRQAGVPIRENREVLPEYFIYRHIMPPETLYRDIHAMTAGSRITFSLKNGRWKLQSRERYTPPTPQDPSEIVVEDVVAKMEDYLKGAIGSVNPENDSVRFLLSGGLDSSILCRIGQKHFGVDTTHSTSYPFLDPDKDREREYAKTAGEAMSLTHHFHQFTIDDYLEAIIRSIAAAEEPVSHLQSPMFYLLYQDMDTGTPGTVISGESADVLFGGEHHKRLRESDRLNSKPYRPLIAGILQLARLSVKLTGRGVGYSELLKYMNAPRKPVNNPDSLLWQWLSFGSEEWVCDTFRVDRSDIIRNRCEVLEHYDEKSFDDLIAIYLLQGFSACSQSVWSKIGESNRNVMYCPYTDNRLADMIFSIPWEIKLKEKKALLRKLARRLDVPEFIITRRKSGFSAGANCWGLPGGLLEPLIPIAAGDFGEESIRSMQSEDPKRSMTYWNLLNYGIWKRICIENEPESRLIEELGKAGSRRPVPA